MTQTTPINDAAVNFISAAPTRKLAPEVLDAAKMALVDWLGCALGAVNEPAARAVRKVALSWGSTSAGARAHMLLGPALSPSAAALANGTMAHCMDYDDTHLDGAGHISGPTWAVALALAEAHGKSEQEALAAYVTGFEVSARLGSGGIGRKLQYKGFHPSSVFGRFAAAATASVLLKLDRGQIAHALGVAGTTVSGLNASFGTMSKPFHLGKAAFDGMLAADMAREGFEAATHLLDAENGVSGTLVQDGSAKIEPTEFSDGHALLRNAYKPYACCKATHACVDAARKLSANVKPGLIQRIVLGASPMTLAVAAKPNPQTPLEGKFSVAYCTALGLSGYAAVESDFNDTRLRDPQIRELIGKSQVVEQPGTDLTEAFVEVELTDGRKLREHIPLALGNPGNPMSWAGMEAKFAGLVTPVLGNETRTLFEMLRVFEQPGTLAKVVNMVGRDTI
jgi:2-methylcitrate dehydratase PrpD